MKLARLKKERRLEMKVCIIGGGAGGRSASRRIRQLDKETQIDVFTKQSEVGYAPCELPFVLRGNIVTWDDIFYPGNFFKEKEINVHFNTEVTDILRQEKCIIAGGENYSYDKAILSLGAVPTTPPIPGLDGNNEFTLSTNIADGRALGEVISEYSSAAVIGTGPIGIEMTQALIARGYRVYLLVRRSISRAHLDEDMAEKLADVFRQNGVELILPAKIKSIASKGGRKRVILDNQELEVDLVFLATGAKPSVELARKAGIQIGEVGAIAVNQYLQTSDPDIYAVGDCMENWDMMTGAKTPRLMVTTAGVTGDVAGTNLVSGNSLPYRGTARTFVIDIFGHKVGTAGFTERVAREKGMDVVSITATLPTTRPKYGDKPVHFRVIGERKTKTLIGAQVISKQLIGGIVGELAVIAAERIPLANVAQIDFPYSPLFGSDLVQSIAARLSAKLS